MFYATDTVGGVVIDVIHLAAVILAGLVYDIRGLGKWLPEAVSAGRAGVPHPEGKSREDRTSAPSGNGQRQLHRRKRQSRRNDRESAHLVRHS